MEKEKFTILVHPEKGERKVKNGYSWTVMLFGIFALLFRREWGVAVSSFIIISASTRAFGPLGGVAWVGWAVYAIFANEQLKQSLIKKGYVVQTPEAVSNNPETQTIE